MTLQSSITPTNDKRYYEKPVVQLHIYSFKLRFTIKVYVQMWVGQGFLDSLSFHNTKHGCSMHQRFYNS